MSHTPLYLVFGGELEDVASAKFSDPSKLNVVGFYHDHEDAKRAWSAIARATIDDAQARYFLVDIAGLL